MSSFDFNPTGDTVAIHSRYGAILISDLNTDEYKYHMELSEAPSNSIIIR